VRGIADQFSDDEMNQIKHYGQMLGGGVTPFDEAVEEALNKRQAAREANASKMHAAQTGGGDVSLGPSEMDTAQIKQRGANRSAGRNPSRCAGPAGAGRTAAGERSTSSFGASRG
jgi:hypothetical protein